MMPGGVRWAQNRVPCRWCDKNRGVVYSNGWGILFCPRCDFAHDKAAGPEVSHRISDVWPKP